MLNLIVVDKAKQEEQKEPESMTKRQAFTGAIIGVAVLVLVGIIIFHHGPKPSHGYTLTPPSGWSKLQPTPKGTSIAFASPDSEHDSTGTLKPFIDVQSYTLDSSGKKLSFNQLADTYIERLSQNYTDYHEVGAYSATIESKPAVLVTFTSVQDQTAVTTDILFTTKYGILYAVNGESLTSTWSQHKQAIQQSLLSFEP